MTDIEALDRAVTEARVSLADAAVRWRKGYLPQGAPNLCTATEAYEAALAARAEADKPKLMTLTEAKQAYTEKTGITTFGWTFHSELGVEAILTATHERALRVIEALPSHVRQMDATGAYVLIPRPQDIDTRERYVSLSDIRTALGVKP